MVTPTTIRTVDLRSDTVTQPTESMRSAMANAEVDDDVLGNDPTAVRLEKEVAEIAGKEAAMFVPSGTMGNLISVLVHCDERGSEVILGDDSHIHIYENGGISSLGGVHPRTVKNKEDGTMEIGSIEAAVRSPKGDIHYPVTKLICLENTQANCGGKCLPIEYIDKVGDLAKKYGLKLHIDGARIFNASIALGVPVKRIVQAADSVSICLSKGIGAPVGSVIVGSRKFIAKARWLRKTLGGGMRQIGVLCAAALVALHENVTKLEDDHKKAKILAEGLSRTERLRVDVAAVETNIIYVDIPEDPKFGAEDACTSLADVGVLVIPQATFRIRIVLHHQISDVDVEYVLSCFEQNQKRRDWNTFCQYLRNHRPPLSLASCSGAHVLEFLRYLDQFGKTKVHHQNCAFFGLPNPPAPCPCPLRQAWGSLDALIGRLRAAYEENGGAPETSPFGSRSVRIFLREVRDFQAKAPGVSYEKKRKRINNKHITQSQPLLPQQPQGQSMMANYHHGATR